MRRIPSVGFGLMLPLLLMGGMTSPAPAQEDAGRVEELEPHRQRPIIVHCHHGGRSQQVTLWLRGQGFAHVQNMAGGIDAWATEIEPGMARY